ncbi:hypothetical protein PoB_000575500 [Plakobranchus ocellatus]|uniref:Uncharacterized protein n=1 Tax=Plakobranchus ocellatus TaxID=259542 RepID=A0AAV3Y7Z7_9GAST|nr:hypothetical protein PoB_000575500 [Plakobranchus ocellatus]
MYSVKVRLIVSVSSSLAMPRQVWYEPQAQFKDSRTLQSVNNKVTSGFQGSVGGSVASESTLRYAGTLLSRVRDPQPEPGLGRPESLSPPCCGLAMYNNPFREPSQNRTTAACAELV